MISLNSYPPEWKVTFPTSEEELELKAVSSETAGLVETLAKAMGGKVELELETVNGNLYRVTVQGPLFADSRRIAKRFVKAVKENHPLARVGFQRFI